jgi:oxygen-independent coproporphyrinogen-3 oxidase
MAGIYIHIPFCRKACHYCNFHFSTLLKGKNDFTQALLKEIELQNNYLQNEAIQTIYFGGGTPSLLEKNELFEIMKQLSQHYNIFEKAEITLEANPDDINKEKLQEWKDAGVNRLSIGIQSFFEEDLKWMNRAHNAEQARYCISLAQQTGFDNLSIDLIYGTPTLTDEKWRENIGIAVAMNIAHLSCYALTVEPGTALQKMITQRKKEDIDTEKQARHFLLLTDWLEQSGYEHYEISNFSKPGYRSRHNSSYWSGEKYLGFGPSAHSFNGHYRQWNISNNALYAQSLLQNTIPFEKELLTTTQHLNEYIMTSLRTREGLNLTYIEEKFGKPISLQLKMNSKKFIENQNLLLNNMQLQLTKEGKLFADGIAADLFFTDSCDDANIALPDLSSGKAPLK